MGYVGLGTLSASSRGLGLRNSGGVIVLLSDPGNEVAAEVLTQDTSLVKWLSLSKNID